MALADRMADLVDRAFEDRRAASERRMREATSRMLGRVAVAPAPPKPKRRPVLARPRLPVPPARATRPHRSCSVCGVDGHNARRHQGELTPSGLPPAATVAPPAMPANDVASPSASERSGRGSEEMRRRISERMKARWERWRAAKAKTTTVEPAPRPRGPRGLGAVVAYGRGFRAQLCRQGRKIYSPMLPTREAAQEALTALVAAAGPLPAPRDRRRVACGQCGDHGHNARTCPAPARGDATVPGAEPIAPAGDAAPEQVGDDVAVPALERARRKLRVLDNGSRQRSRTIAPTRLSREERAAAEAIGYPADVKRPQTRGDCEGGPRPCPFVSCSQHLYLDVQDSGAIKLNFPHLDVAEMTESCALDVADRGGVTLEEVGVLVNVTRERVRQLETRGLEKMKRAAGDDLGVPPDAPTGWQAVG